MAKLDAAVQGAILADVRDALGGYGIGDSVTAPVEAHPAIGYR